MSMHTLNELAIFRARLLREHRQPGGAMAEASISQLDETIISRPATNPDEGIAKLELARDLAAAKGKTKIVQLIEGALRSEEHTSELQSLMRISYAVFCLKKKKTQILNTNTVLYI